MIRIMKRILSIIAVLFTATILSGSGNKAKVWKYELPLSFYGEFDSIPTINQFGQVRNGIIVDNIISVYNADPNGVDLTNTQIEAFRMLVGGMYTTGTWQKCKAIYPFIGGSEYKHKWNIKDLRDLDVAYRLSFLGGGWVHSSSGATPEAAGNISYANTFINASTNLTLNSTHLSFYSGTNETTAPFDLACSDGTNLFGLYSNFSGNIFNSQYNGTNGRFLTPETRGDGYFIVNRTSSSLNQTYRNSLLKGISTVSTSIGVLPNANIEIGRLGVTVNYKKQARFTSIGSGLTDTEAIRQSNIVTQVQRHLSRQ